MKKFLLASTALVGLALGRLCPRRPLIWPRRLYQGRRRPWLRSTTDRYTSEPRAAGGGGAINCGDVTNFTGPVARSVKACHDATGAWCVVVGGQIGYAGSRPHGCSVWKRGVKGGSEGIECQSVHSPLAQQLQDRGVRIVNRPGRLCWGQTCSGM